MVRYQKVSKYYENDCRDVAWWALTKLDVEERLVKIVQSMYRNARSPDRVIKIFGNNFLVQVGLSQGSVLSRLLFAVVLDALSREVRPGCP